MFKEIEQLGVPKDYRLTMPGLNDQFGFAHFREINFYFNFF